MSTATIEPIVSHLARQDGWLPIAELADTKLKQSMAEAYRLGYVDTNGHAIRLSATGRALEAAARS